MPVKSFGSSSRALADGSQCEPQLDTSSNELNCKCQPTTGPKRPARLPGSRSGYPNKCEFWAADEPFLVLITSKFQPMPPMRYGTATYAKGMGLNVSP